MGYGVAGLATIQCAATHDCKTHIPSTRTTSNDENLLQSRCHEGRRMVGVGTERRSVSQDTERRKSRRHSDQHRLGYVIVTGRRGSDACGIHFMNAAQSDTTNHPHHPNKTVFHQIILVFPLHMSSALDTVLEDILRVRDGYGQAANPEGTPTTRCSLKRMSL